MGKDSKAETHSNSSSRERATMPLIEGVEVRVGVFDSMNLIECLRIFSNARSTLPQTREAASASFQRFSVVGEAGCKRIGRVADDRRSIIQLPIDVTKLSTEW